MKITKNYWDCDLSFKDGIACCNDDELALIHCETIAEKCLGRNPIAKFQIWEYLKTTGESIEDLEKRVDNFEEIGINGIFDANIFFSLNMNKIKAEFNK